MLPLEVDCRLDSFKLSHLVTVVFFNIVIMLTHFSYYSFKQIGRQIEKIKSDDKLTQQEVKNNFSEIFKF